jgi:hypothetical protein
VAIGAVRRMRRAPQPLDGRRAASRHQRNQKRTKDAMMICPGCNVDFTPPTKKKGAKQRWCSKACWFKWRDVERNKRDTELRTCAWCKKEFRNRRATPDLIHCSRTCSIRSHKADPSTREVARASRDPNVDPLGRYDVVRLADGRVVNVPRETA